MKFSHSFRVESSDIDEQGHVNNVAFLRWIQDVALAHWHHSATQAQIDKFAWFVVRHEIDYKKQAFEQEEISVTTWVNNWTKVTCERHTEVTRGTVLLVKAKTVWCIIDRTSSKPTKITTDLIERFK